MLGPKFGKDGHLLAPADCKFGKAVQTQGKPVSRPTRQHLEAESIRVNEFRLRGVRRRATGLIQ